MRVACPGLSRRLEEGCFEKATVVTPSAFIAAIAAQHFSAHKLSEGLEAWERPVIFSVDAWLATSWHEVRYKVPEVPALLSPLQEHALWQTIIETQHVDLFDLNATARLARRSARLVAEYHIPPEGNLWHDNQDAHEFQEWNRAFRRECREKGWITRSDLWHFLPKWISAGHFRPDRVIFAGFTRSTPAMEGLKRALGDRAVTQPMLHGRKPDTVLAKCCAAFSEEVEFAARWARANFEEQPSRAIGIFVPDLATHRSLVERTFQRVFYSSGMVGAASGHASVFHIAADTSLKDHPLCTAALLLLELARPRIHHADAGAILRCPFITGAAAERNARALADIELRKRREIDVSLRQLEYAAKECPSLTQMWPRVRRVLGGRSDLLELPAWSEFIADLLKALGWPGDADLTAEEQKLVDMWKDALSSLSALGIVSGRVSYDTALMQLKSLLETSGVQTGDWFSPVQILDSQDAASVELDCACLTGLSDETWPPAVNISALIPLELQRTHHVPGSSPESARRERERMTDSLFSTAPILAATYSGRLSPAAERFCDKRAAGKLTAWKGKLPRQSYTLASLDEIEDYHAPPYRAVREARGGTSIIKAQSLCPFRGFAQKRLNANPLEDACFGFDARDRGTFLHEAVRYVWEQLRTQARLRLASAGELRALAREAVTRAVKGDQGSEFHQQNSLAERERLEELTLDWLLLEAGRRQPFEVETTELKRNVRIGGLDLSVRIDRIDRLANGKLVLIDYKSGETNRKNLEGERPAEPQLLVYASVFRESVDGVFFGQLTPRRPRGVGFARQDHFGQQDETRQDWDSYMLKSQQNVERIARTFVEGYAAVDPIKDACTYCGAQPFCRIYQQRETARGEQE